MKGKTGVKNLAKFYLIAMVLLPSIINAQSEYEDFVSALPKRMTGEEIRTNSEKQQKVYEESELYKFQRVDTTSLKGVWNFYTNIVKKKYEGHEQADFLKLKFIQFAVRGFDLRLRENAESTRQLIVYTRELVKLRNNFEVEFSYYCIAAIKNLIPKEELNQMIKTERFKIRFMLEQFKTSLAYVEKDTNHPKGKSKTKQDT